jgi:hypothetical protein
VGFARLEPGIELPRGGAAILNRRHIELGSGKRIVVLAPRPQAGGEGQESRCGRAN